MANAALEALVDPMLGPTPESTPAPLSGLEALVDPMLGPTIPSQATVRATPPGKSVFEQAMGAVQAPPGIRLTPPGAQPSIVKPEPPAALAKGAEVVGESFAEGVNDITAGATDLFKTPAGPLGETTLTQLGHAAKIANGLAKIVFAIPAGAGKTVEEATTVREPVLGGPPEGLSAQPPVPGTGVPIGIVNAIFGVLPGNWPTTPEEFRALPAKIAALPAEVWNTPRATAPEIANLITQLWVAGKGAQAIKGVAEARRRTAVERPPTPAPVEPAIAEAPTPVPAQPVAPEVVPPEGIRAPSVIEPSVSRPTLAPVESRVDARKRVVATGLTFREFVEAKGTKWPIAVTDPSYARLRADYDAIGNPIVSARGKEIVDADDRPVAEFESGARAELEANRRNADVAHQRVAEIRGPQPPAEVRMEIARPEKPPEPMVTVPEAMTRQEEALARALAAVERARQPEAAPRALEVPQRPAEPTAAEPVIPAIIGPQEFVSGRLAKVSVPSRPAEPVGPRRGAVPPPTPEPGARAEPILPAGQKVEPRVVPAEPGPLVDHLLGTIASAAELSPDARTLVARKLGQSLDLLADPRVREPEGVLAEAIRVIADAARRRVSLDELRRHPERVSPDAAVVARALLERPPAYIRGLLERRMEEIEPAIEPGTVAAVPPEVISGERLAVPPPTLEPGPVTVLAEPIVPPAATSRPVLERLGEAMQAAEPVQPMRFSRERRDRAVENLTRVLNQLKGERGSFDPRARLDPAIFSNLVDIGGYYVAQGLTTFAAWARRMRDEFGERITPYLEPVWQAIQDQLRGRVKEESRPLFPPSPSEKPVIAETREPLRRPDLLAKLVAFGGTVYQDGATDFVAWSRGMRDALGDAIEPFLDQAWSEVQRIKQIGQRETGTAIGPQVTPEPPPLTQPTLRLEAERSVVQAARDLFVTAGMQRHDAQLLSDQILELMQQGRLKLADLTPALVAHGLDVATFGEQLFRPAARYAGQFLNQLSQLQRELNRLDPESRKALDALTDIAAEIDADARGMNWLRRVDNIRRGLLVTQLATAMRNYETQVSRLGLDVLDLALQRQLQRWWSPHAPTANPAEAYGALLDVWRQIKSSTARKQITENVNQILSTQPRLYDRLLGTYSSDIIRQAQATGQRVGVLDRVGHAVDMLNIANRFQEYIVRRAVFQATLADLMQQQGKDLRAMLRDGTAGTIPKELLAIAVGKALEVTFAKNPKYGGIGDHFIKFVNDWPFLATAVIPFPRFITNALRFQAEFSPLGFAWLFRAQERAALRAGHMRVISRAMLGSTALLAAYAMRAEQPDGNRWYELTFGGKVIDTRPFNPFASYLFVADLAKKTLEEAGLRKGPGFIRLDVLDIVNGIAASSFRAGLGLYFFDSVLRDLVSSDPSRAMKNIKTWPGELVGAALTPLQTLLDLLAQYDEHLAIVRESRKEPFLGPIKKRFGIGEPVYRPTRAEPVRREAPALRQLTGVTVGHKNPLEIELDRLQFDRAEILGSKGDPEADNLIAKHMGQLAEARLVPYVQSPAYQRLGDGAKGQMLRQRLKPIRAVATARAQREQPDLFRELKEERRPLRERMFREERQRAHEETAPTPEEVEAK